MFNNRQDAGRQLAKRLDEYGSDEVVVYALPRGGVPVAFEIAEALEAPLNLVVTRKIGHPQNREYAIGAVAKSGEYILDKKESKLVDPEWLKLEIEKERKEAQRRQAEYLKGQKPLDATGKTVILVDDGVATGMSIKLAIEEIKKQNPKKVVVAVPVLPKSEAEVLRDRVDRVVSVLEEDAYRGAVGAYYRDFSQVSDQEVVSLLGAHERV